MSGPLGVPISVAGYYLTGGLAKALFAVTGIFCVFLAMYLVWRMERLKVVNLENKIVELEKPNPLVDAQREHTEELRKQREQKDKENTPEFLENKRFNELLLNIKYPPPSSPPDYRRTDYGRED